MLEAEGPELERPESALGEPTEERVVKSLVTSDLNLQSVKEAFCRHPVTVSPHLWLR